jgi:hypothetical protein
MSILEKCLELHSTKQEFPPMKCDIHRHRLYSIIKKIYISNLQIHNNYTIKDANSVPVHVLIFIYRLI